MSDSVILISGIFCFSLALIGLVLTIAEFRKMSNKGASSSPR
jgi:hypothetical protein